MTDIIFRRNLPLFVTRTHARARSLPAHMHTCTHAHMHTCTQQQVAGQVLTQFKEHPESWTRVDTILELSDNQKTKVGLCSDVRGGEGRELNNVTNAVASSYHSPAGTAYTQLVHCSLCAPQNVGGCVVELCGVACTLMKRDYLNQNCLAVVYFCVLSCNGSCNAAAHSLAIARCV